jgi:hypothetical protein
MDVEMAQLISNEQHEGLVNRVTNFIALPPFLVDGAEGRKAQIPITRWKQEIDMVVKSKVYKKELPTEILLPILYDNQWLLLIWDFARRVREALIFKEFVMKD